MELAKSGNIGKLCVPNAISTFSEYTNDFASVGTKIVANEFIQNEIEKFNGITRHKTEEMLKRVNNGERDVFF